MRILSIILILLILTLPLIAQEETPLPPPTPDVVPTLIFLADQGQQRANESQAAVVRAENAADRADVAVARVDDGVEDAFSLLGLYESVGVTIGLLTAVAGAFAAVIGGLYARNIQRAISQLEETRQLVKKEVEDTKQMLKDEVDKTQTLIEHELEEERQRLNAALKEKSTELETLHQELESTARAQREETTRALMAHSLLNLAERQYRATDFKGAIDTYKRALELDVLNPITHYQLGYVYIHSDLLEQAVEHLSRALEMDPQLAQAQAALGYALRRQGEAMEKGPERNRMLNRAESNLLDALSLSPRMLDNDGESWWGSLGGLYRRMGRVEQTIDAYEHAADVTPHSSYPFSNLALLHSLNGDYDAMIKAYERVERLALTETNSERNNYWAYNDLLTARLAQGKVAEAEQTLLSLFYSAPTDASYPLGVLVSTLQQLTQALSGHDQARYIPEFIERIQHHMAEHIKPLSEEGK